MSISIQTAQHFREIYFGGNWTAVSLKESLSDVTWEQATHKIQSFNTIATLVFHIGYYVTAALDVLNDMPLEAKDEYSFNHPAIDSEKQWEELLAKTWTEGERFAHLIEVLPESKFWEPFSEEKYGNYYRNINGIIEHAHYHLGQIILLKKMI